MRTQAFLIKEDGSIDLSNSIVVSATTPMPDGYRLALPEDDLTYGEPLEIEPQEPTVEERLEQTEELLRIVTMAFTEYVFMQDTSDDS